MKNQNDWVVFNGNIIPDKEPVAPVLSRGLMYGDGAFETFRIYRKRTFLLNKHLQRLYKALKYLNITPPDELSLQQIKSLALRLLQKKKLGKADAIARLQVWREGPRGYSTKHSTGSHFSLTISACPDSFEPRKLASTSIKRIPSGALPSHYKLTNGLNYILAAREADKRGADDALMETIEGYVSETTIANIFWMKGNSVYTPSKECDLLPGITREVLIKVAQNHRGVEILEGKFLLKDLLKADAVWITNSVREVLPVKEVNDVRFSTSYEYVSQLCNAFKAFRNNALKEL